MVFSFLETMIKDGMKVFLEQAVGFLDDLKGVVAEIEDIKATTTLKKDTEKEVQKIYSQLDTIVDGLNKQSKKVQSKIAKVEEMFVGFINESNKRNKSMQDKMKEEIKADITAFGPLFNNLKETLKTAENDILRNREDLEKMLEKKLEKGDLKYLEDGLQKIVIDDENISDKTAYSSEKTIEKIDSIINNLRLGGRGKIFIQNDGSDLGQATAINFTGSGVTTTVENGIHTVTVTGGGASSLEVTQTAHGFVALDWLYFDDADSTYKKALADAEATLGMRHVVEVVDANTFKIAKDGVHEIANALPVGEYVLSNTTAGSYTQTIPGNLGDYILYGMEVLSATEISFYTVAAITVGVDITGAGVANEIAYWIDNETLGSVTGVTATELGYLDGATSNIQDQIDTITSTNTGDQTITLTGDVTGSGTGSFATTIANDAVTFAKTQNITTNRILGRQTAGNGDIEELTATSIPSMIGLGTSDSPQFSEINIGHATDTTISRVRAGVIAVEGVNVGYLEIPQNSQSSAYTTVLGDSGKHLYHPSSDTTARTWTIDSNANVAYPIGTAITFVNDSSAGTITIAITSDTLVLAGAGTTGSRTLAANGVATAIKVTSTRWIISGTNLT